MIFPIIMIMVCAALGGGAFLFMGSIFGSFAFDEPNNLKKEATSFFGKPPLAASDADILAGESGWLSCRKNLHDIENFL
ncbi:hypothetical protein JCM17380_34110 [Desulfosporosinus burensis]